jgi:hypothetical protein
MGKVTRIDTNRNLSDRRRITLELPEFMIRAFQYRLAEANDGAPDEDRVTIEQFVELQLAEALSIAEVAILEERLPGIVPR